MSAGNKSIKIKGTTRHEKHKQDEACETETQADGIEKAERIAAHPTIPPTNDETNNRTNEHTQSRKATKREPTLNVSAIGYITMHRGRPGGQAPPDPPALSTDHFATIRFLRNSTSFCASASAHKLSTTTQADTVAQQHGIEQQARSTHQARLRSPKLSQDVTSNSPALRSCRHSSVASHETANQDD